ncbi:hypothetical protein WJX81_001179 [Elliptochloris bilobata]|uniref:C3H1-type domain-containing protein n=1 Tax=Elliptochloris bilobata TaxID=381761 RepID=A0AAW1QML2_9CHLO
MAAQRAARKQVARPVVVDESIDKADYNIWHHKPNRRKAEPKRAATHRCHPARDSGRTRGSDSGASFRCIDFARGICAAGYSCNYLHRVPTAQDEARAATDLSVDTFGRGKVTEARDNRLGAGSFERDCRTLYVNYSGAISHMQTGLQAKQLLEPEFAEWGPLERTHIVHDKRLAFVTYTQRSSAEFAKEAMAQQRVPGGDMEGFLDVRWANEDPNPRAQARVKRAHADAYSQAVARSVDELPEAAKRARLMDLHIQASTRARGHCASAPYYPDTSAQ